MMALVMRVVSVDEIVHIRPVEADRLEGCEQARHAVSGASRNLCGSGFAARALHCDYVRERAANVDTDFPSIRHGVVSAVFLIIGILISYIGNNE